MKLGQEIMVNKGVKMWGGKIERVWLTKWLPTGHYQLLGLVRKEDGEANGWCVLKDSERIGDCRRAALNY